MRINKALLTFLKGLLPFIGLALLVAFGIYLSATAKPSSSKVKNIRWVVDPHPIRPTTIALFEKNNPGIHVINDPDAASQRLLTQLAGNVPPDIMTIYSLDQLNKFAKTGLLLDLTPYVKKYKIPVDELWPQLKSYVYYKGKVVGIPENGGNMYMFYNKKLFRQAGVPYPKEGWTWDDYIDAAKKLTVYKVVNGRKMPVQKGLYVDNIPCIFIWKYGGSFFSPDGKKCLMDSKECKEGIRYWYDLRMKYHVLPTGEETSSMASMGGYGGAFLLFAQSKAAMVITGRYMVPQFRVQKGLEWDVAPYPRGKYTAAPFLSKCYAIPKACKNKETAIKFLCNILSRENQKLISDFADGLPSRNSPEVIKDYLYNPEYPNETKNQLFIDELKFGRDIEWSPYISGADQAAITNIELDKMWLEGQSPDDACNNIARKINEVIRRNLANPNFLK
ncbi:sugar ABC transporter substrate-binding protein [bacterium]|nr:sugar ABC transporter substrate-binding protein [bacterium]